MIIFTEHRFFLESVHRSKDDMLFALTTNVAMAKEYGCVFKKGMLCFVKLSLRKETQHSSGNWVKKLCNICQNKYCSPCFLVIFNHLCDPMNIVQQSRLYHLTTLIYIQLWIQLWDCLENWFCNVTELGAKKKWAKYWRIIIIILRVFKVVSLLIQCVKAPEILFSK